MPSDITTLRVRAASPDDKQVWLDAELVRSANGLAITRLYPENPSGYSITHIATGYAADRSMPLHIAEKALDYLTDGLDWTGVPTHEMKKGSPWYERVVSMREQEWYAEMYEDEDDGLADLTSGLREKVERLTAENARLLAVAEAARAYRDTHREWEDAPAFTARKGDAWVRFEGKRAALFVAVDALAALDAGRP